MQPAQQAGLVVQVAPLGEVGAIQAIGHLPLLAVPPGEKDQPVPIHRVRRACDAVEDELDAIRRADLRHMVEHLLGPRPKLLRDERIPVLACRVSIWVQLEGPPVQLNLDVRALGRRCAAAALDVTPGAVMSA